MPVMYELKLTWAPFGGKGQKEYSLTWDGTVTPTYCLPENNTENIKKKKVTLRVPGFWGVFQGHKTCLLCVKNMEKYIKNEYHVSAAVYHFTILLIFLILCHKVHNLHLFMY